MRFGDILGHDAVKRRLQGEIAADRLSHVYLFWGPDGVGKQAVALAMAQTLLCEKKGDGGLFSATRRGGAGACENGKKKTPVPFLPDACGACRACQLVEAGTHPDLHLIVKEMIHQYKSDSKGTSFSIELVRQEVIARAGQRPMQSDHRVFVLDEAHLLQEAAANALLKVLEEPPPACRLILVAPTLEGFLPTVLSRVRQIGFSPLPRQIVIDYLRGRAEVGAGDAAVLAAMTGGSIGASLAWLADGVLDFRRELFDRLGRLAVDNDLATADALREQVRQWADAWHKQSPQAGKSEAGRRAGMRLIALVTWYYRDLLVLAAGGAESLVANRDCVAELKAGAGRTTVADLRRRLLALAQADQRLALNANLDLTLQVLAAQLADPRTVQDLSRPLKRAILA